VGLRYYATVWNKMEKSPMTQTTATTDSPVKSTSTRRVRDRECLDHALAHTGWREISALLIWGLRLIVPEILDWFRPRIGSSSLVSSS